MTGVRAPEEWRDIPDFPGYQVSSWGRIASKPGKGWRTWKLRALAPTRSGHMLVTLRRDGRSITRGVHRFVAAAFIGPAPDGLEVCHRDGDGQNNVPSNLYYGSRSQNLRDSVRHGTHVCARKTHCPYGHPLAEPNLTKSGTREGRRRCLACSRAGSYVKNHGDRYGETFTREQRKQLADTYYSDIIARSAA